METIDLGVAGMRCQACVNSVKAALAGITGVEHIEVSLETGRATVSYDPKLVTVTALITAIDEAGFASN